MIEKCKTVKGANVEIMVEQIAVFLDLVYLE